MLSATTPKKKDQCIAAFSRHFASAPGYRTNVPVFTSPLLRTAWFFFSILQCFYLDCVIGTVWHQWTKDLHMVVSFQMSALDNQNLGSVTVDGFADSEDPESYRVIASHRRWMTMICAAVTQNERVTWRVTVCDSESSCLQCVFITSSY